MVDNLNSGNEGSSGEYDEFRGRYSYFDSNRDLDKPHFKLGIRFSGRNEFKTVVKTFCIFEGKVCHFKPSEPARVRAKCRTKVCKWFIFASIERATQTKDLVVKSMNLNHNNCNH